MTSSTKIKSAWTWVPSLYFAEGLPYIIVMFVSGAMYKLLNISNTDIALYTGLLYLPWVIKPIWSPFVDIFKTKRCWILITQLTISFVFIGIAISINTQNFFLFTIIFFWILAFSSATHDIAADGFYMIGLNNEQQAKFIGVRTIFYRIAMIVGQGLLIIFAGYFQNIIGIKYAWSLTFLLLAFIFISIYFYHSHAIPHANEEKISQTNIWSEFLKTFVLFFKKKDITSILFFLLLFRFAEGQLVKIGPLFLLDSKENGGLALSTIDVGFTYGTVGFIALLTGGLLGGYAIAKKGLKRWLWIMVLCVNIPDVVYVLLSQFQPSNLILINIAISIEQLGYGFGFVSYMIYMIYISDGKHKTAHYAICTGFMALSMMLPGMISGAIQEYIGYKLFFIWIMISTIPAFIVTSFINIPNKIVTSD